MSKPGRNDPCPCGSGKKFKRCCWGKTRPAIATRDPLEGPVMVEDDIDRLSNQVPALLRQERYAEAEAVCRRLEEEFPEQVDGIERRAEVEEARGRWERASGLYRKAATKHLKNDPEYGLEPAEYCREMARKMDDQHAAEQASRDSSGNPS